MFFLYPRNEAKIKIKIKQCQVDCCSNHDDQDATFYYWCNKSCFEALWEDAKCKRRDLSLFIDT